MSATVTPHPTDGAVRCMSRCHDGPDLAQITLYVSGDLDEGVANIVG
jgi:hypothetical protein